MDWKQSLDRWLTTEPDNGFDGYCEKVIDLIPQDIYEANEEWLLDTSFNSQSTKILSIAFNEDMDYEQAAEMLINALNN